MMNEAAQEMAEAQEMLWRLRLEAETMQKDAVAQKATDDAQKARDEAEIEKKRGELRAMEKAQNRKLFEQQQAETSQMPVYWQKREAAEYKDGFDLRPLDSEFDNFVWEVRLELTYTCLH